MIFPTDSLYIYIFPTYSQPALYFPYIFPQDEGVHGRLLRDLHEAEGRL